MTATNTNKVRSVGALRTSKTDPEGATDMTKITPEPATRHENQKIDRELDVIDRGLANLKSIIDRAEGFTDGVTTVLMVEVFAIAIYILIRWAFLVGGAR